MNQLKVKKLHPDAKLPRKAHATDAGWDIYTPLAFYVAPGETDVVNVQLAVEIPEGFYGHMRPRSSQFKVGVNVSGVVDSSYRGALRVMITNTNSSGDFGDRVIYERGDRIAQMLILPVPEFEVVEVQELSETTRGSGGFGSSGA